MYKQVQCFISQYAPYLGHKTFCAKNRCCRTYSITKRNYQTPGYWKTTSTSIVTEKGCTVCEYQLHLQSMKFNSLAINSSTHRLTVRSPNAKFVLWLPWCHSSKIPLHNKCRHFVLFLTLKKKIPVMQEIDFFLLLISLKKHVVICFPFIAILHLSEKQPLSIFYAQNCLKLITAWN